MTRAWPDTLTKLSLADLLELSANLFVPSADWEAKADRLHVELEILLLEGAE